MTEPSAREQARQVVLLNTLRQCPLFADMAPPDLEDIATTCDSVRLEKGETLFRENEKALGFYIVQQGAIHVHRNTADGHEQMIAVFRPFNCFAEVCLTTFQTYPADAVALEPSTVVLVRKADFRELIMRTPELALRMLTSMSFHLKHLVQTMEDQKFKRIEGRLAQYLVRLCPMIDRDANAVVRLNSSKKILAGQLGVSSETLSRALARFRREKLVSVRGLEIRILNLEGLRGYLEDQ
jgi:CRP/FNR family transcriptional regulator